jgi:hypothetical protein
MQNLREKSNLDKNETRPSRYGALDLFMNQSNQAGGLLTPALRDAAEKSIGRVLQTPVIDYDGGVTIGNTRSVTIADDENTSQMFDITFATYSWRFTSVPALFMNNEISMQEDFNAKFTKYLYKLGSTLDTAGVASLNAARTQVFADLLSYTNTGNEVQAPWALRENIMGDIDVMLAANDHFGDIHVLGNGGVESVIRKLAESSLYNAENKVLQYSDKTLHFTNRIANAAGDFGNAFAVAGGSLGVLTRFEREAILGTEMANGTEWGIDTLPMLNLPVGTYYYESVGDANAIAGAASADMTRNRKEHYGFSVDVAFVTPYNSDPSTIANPIMKFAILKEA